MNGKEILIANLESKIYRITITMLITIMETLIDDRRMETIERAHEAIKTAKEILK